MLIRGELYKFEISKERYELHKEQGYRSTLTIEDIDGEWGIFMLERCYRSFNERFMIELRLLYQVSSMEKGRRLVELMNEDLQKKFNRELKTEVTEYYEKR